MGITLDYLTNQIETFVVPENTFIVTFTNPGSVTFIPPLQIGQLIFEMYRQRKLETFFDKFKSTLRFPLPALPDISGLKNRYNALINTGKFEQAFNEMKRYILAISVFLCRFAGPERNPILNICSTNNYGPGELKQVQMGINVFYPGMTMHNLYMKRDSASFTFGIPQNPNFPGSGDDSNFLGLYVLNSSANDFDRVNDSPFVR